MIPDISELTTIMKVFVSILAMLFVALLIAGYPGWGFMLLFIAAIIVYMPTIKKALGKE